MSFLMGHKSPILVRDRILMRINFFTTKRKKLKMYVCVLKVKLIALCQKLALMVKEYGTSDLNRRLILTIRFVYGHCYYCVPKILPLFRIKVINYAFAFDYS